MIFAKTGHIMRYSIGQFMCSPHSNDNTLARFLALGNNETILDWRRVRTYLGNNKKERWNNEICFAVTSHSVHHNPSVASRMRKYAEADDD